MAEAGMRGERVFDDRLERLKGFLERAMLMISGAMATLFALRLAEAPDLRAASGWVLAVAGVVIVLWAVVARVLGHRRYRARTRGGAG